jgi:hypothetical protein
MKRYEVTGIPLGAPFSALADRRVGDQFDADLDPDIEHLLVGAGALVEVTDARTAERDDATDDDPQPPPKARAPRRR